MADKVYPQRSRKQKQDDSVIATNNSSIVSKRSVERLYYPEPHFYRYFVKKPLRRSPLINRKSCVSVKTSVSTNLGSLLMSTAEWRDFLLLYYQN